VLLLARGDGRDRTVAATALLANGTSHPVLWFLLLPALDAVLPWVAAVVVAELVAMAYEAVVLRRLAGTWPRAGAVALATNAASVAVGLFVNAAVR
jgi:hypothetical protein